LKLLETSITILLIYLVFVSTCFYLGLLDGFKVFLGKAIWPLTYMRMRSSEIFSILLKEQGRVVLLSELNELLKKELSITGIEPPLRVAFYNHYRGNHLLLDAVSTPLLGSPVVAFESKHIVGVVVGWGSGYIEVEPLKFLEFRIPAVARHRSVDIEGFVYSEHGRVFFKTFDPVKLEYGDEVTLSPSIEGFGYLYHAGLTVIGQITTPFRECGNYLLKTLEISGELFIYLGGE